MPLAHRDAADRDAGQVHRHHRLRAALAQVAVGAALHDPEQRLVAAARVRLRAALEPRERAAHARARELLVGRVRRALVERHDDVGAERVLDLDRALGRELDRRAVDLALEAHAAVGDLGLRQREHLEAAAVGEDRAVPAHERVQAAELRHELLAGPQREVIGVREHDLAAGRGDLLGRHRLHRAVRADRHERGRRERPVRRRERARARVAAPALEREAERLRGGGAHGSNVRWQTASNPGSLASVADAAVCPQP